MMCNKCGSNNITTAYICVKCGNDCQPIRTTSGTIPTYFNTVFYSDYPTVQAKRTVIGKVTPLYEGAL